MEAMGLLWEQPEWRAEAEAWIQAQLSSLGRERIGPIDQPHIRPWSTVLLVPTQSGNLYFKASGPMFAHETALTAALSHWHPGAIPQVLAADTERSWMLLADGGVRMRTLLQEDRDLRHWQRVIPSYVGLQIAMAERAEALLEMGLPDRCLAALRAQVERLLANTDALLIGQENGLSAEEYQRLRDFLPQLAPLCEQLAAYGLPETLQHDDLHDGNILVAGGRYLIFDWGDSCISHPFFSLLVILRSAANTLGLPDDAPELHSLRDLYLDAWNFRLPPADRQTAFALAYRLGMLCRVLTWYRLITSLEGPIREQYADYVPAWLQEFLAADKSLG